MTESWDLCPSQELWAARGLHHHRKPVRTVGGLISTDGTDYALGVQTRSINPKDSVPFPILIRKEGVLNGGGVGRNHSEEIQERETCSSSFLVIIAASLRGEPRPTPYAEGPHRTPRVPRTPPAAPGPALCPVADMMLH